MPFSHVFMAGPLRVHAVEPDVSDASAPLPSAVLCHGFGAPGDDLLPLVSYLAPPQPVRWFFPEAPQSLDASYGSSGRAWWPLDLFRLQAELAAQGPAALRRATPPGMAEARDALRACLESLMQEHGVDSSSLWLGGFSQGAMVTTEMVLGGAFRPAGLLLLSGTVLCEDRWREANPHAIKDLPVFQSHGTHDPVLPYEGGQHLTQLLSSLGAAVEFVSFAGGHAIPADVLDRLRSFLRERLA